jgi:tetratricopeptide (TPR) repeat protein
MSSQTTGRAALYRIDGSRRPNEEILAERGNIGLRLALLDEAMHGRATSAEADACYPPHLFLSYKWGSAEENAWVKDLADCLTARGWDVVYDQRRDESEDRTVEEFVSRLVTCRVFVAVLSPAYIASAFEASRPTWVFDEMQCALLARDRMRLIALVPPSELAKTPPAQPARDIELPKIPAIVVQPLQRAEVDELHEIRSNDDLERVLDSALTYSGPRLDAAQQTWVIERLEREDDAAALREIVERHPFVAGAWRRLIVLARDRGDLDAARVDAERALEFVHEPVERLPFLREHLELLKRSGDRSGAARAAVAIIDQYPHDWVAHFHLGDMLDDANDGWPARNHLLLACRSPEAGAHPHNTLAVVYMGLGLFKRAAQSLEQALRLDATLVVAQRNLERTLAELGSTPQSNFTEVDGPLPGCSACAAIFMQPDDRPVLCASCGASRPDASPCEICGNDGIAPLVPIATGYLATRCPICRTGTITSRERALL